MTCRIGRKAKEGLKNGSRPIRQSEKKRGRIIIMVLLFLKSIVLDSVLTLSETPSGVELFRPTDYSHRLHPTHFSNQIL